MANLAAAQEVICTLRRKIAKIEGVLPEPLAVPAKPGGEAAIVLRRQGMPEKPRLSTGAGRFDAALDGVPSAGLVELHGAVTRDSGAVAESQIRHSFRAGSLRPRIGSPGGGPGGPIPAPSGPPGGGPRCSNPNSAPGGGRRSFSAREPDSWRATSDNRTGKLCIGGRVMASVMPTNSA